VTHYNEVRRRYLAGEKLLAISRAMGLARGTVRKLAYADAFPERAVRVPPPSIIDPYLPHLEARLARLRERCPIVARVSGARFCRHLQANPPLATGPANQDPQAYRLSLA